MEQITIQNEKRIGTKSMWKKTLLFVLMYLFIDLLTYNAGITGMYAGILIVISLIGLCFFNIKSAFFFMIPVFIFSDDISRIDPYNDISFNSILNIKLLGLPVSHYLTFTIFAILLAEYLYKLIFKKVYKVKINPLIGKYFFVFIMLYFFMAISGIQNLPSHFRYYINDLSPIFYTGTYFWLTLRLINSKQDLNKIFWLLILALAAKNIVWFFEYFMGIGYEFGTTLRVMSESGKVLSVLLIYFPLAALIFKNKEKYFNNIKIFSVFMLIFAFFNIFAYASRGTWIYALIGFFVFLTFLPKVKRLKVFVSGIILAAVIITSTFIIKPQARSVYSYLTKTIVTTFTGEVSEFNHSSAVRLFEGLNIYAKLKKNKTILTGHGAGAWFDYSYARFPFPFTSGDYVEKELSAQTFHKPHNSFLNIFLKSGILGLFVFIFVQIMFFANSYKIAQITEDIYRRAVLTGIVSGLPLILLSNWTTKMNMFIGIILAIILKIHIFNKPKGEEEFENIACDNSI